MCINATRFNSSSCRCAFACNRSSSIKTSLSLLIAIAFSPTQLSFKCILIVICTQLIFGLCYPIGSKGRETKQIKKKRKECTTKEDEQHIHINCCGFQLCHTSMQIWQIHTHTHTSVSLKINNSMNFVFKRAQKQ